jgi:hypothetical protein
MKAVLIVGQAQDNSLVSTVSILGQNATTSNVVRCM